MGADGLTTGGLSGAVQHALDKGAAFDRLLQQQQQQQRQQQQPAADAKAGACSAPDQLNGHHNGSSSSSANCDGGCSVYVGDSISDLLPLLKVRLCTLITAQCLPSVACTWYYLGLAEMTALHTNMSSHLVPAHLAWNTDIHSYAPAPQTLPPRILHCMQVHSWLMCRVHLAIVRRHFTECEASPTWLLPRRRTMASSLVATSCCAGCASTLGSAWHRCAQPPPPQAPSTAAARPTALQGLANSARCCTQQTAGSTLLRSLQARHRCRRQQLGMPAPAAAASLWVPGAARPSPAAMAAAAAGATSAWRGC
jgi:hypothetical protein